MAHILLTFAVLFGTVFQVHAQSTQSVRDVPAWLAASLCSPDEDTGSVRSHDCLACCVPDAAAADPQTVNTVARRGQTASFQAGSYTLVDDATWHAQARAPPFQSRSN